MRRPPAEKIPDFNGLGGWALGFFKSLLSLERRLKITTEKHKTALRWWLIKTVVLSLSLFMSLASLILGLLFLAMDYGGVPRGAVFTGGGMCGLLFLGLWFQRQNQKHGE